MAAGWNDKPIRFPSVFTIRMRSSNGRPRKYWGETIPNSGFGTPPYWLTSVTLGFTPARMKER